VNLDPTRTALLLMEYQVGLLSRLPDAEALLDRVSAAMNRDYRIVLLNDTSRIFPRDAAVIDVDLGPIPGLLSA